MNPLHSTLSRWLLACLAALAIHTPGWAAQPLHFCLPDLEALPYLAAQGEPPGLLERLLIEAGRQSATEVIISRAPIRRCMLQLKQGAVDGAIAGWNSQNRELARFPMKGGKIDAARRIVRVSTVWLRRRGEAVHWDGQRLSKPSGEPVTVGSLRAVAVIADALQLDGYHLEDTSISVHQLLQQLRIGRVDAALALSDQVQRELRAGGFDELEVLPGTARQFDFYAAVSYTRHAASQEQIERFWDRLARLRELAPYRPAR